MTDEPEPKRERHWGNAAAGFSAACALALSAYTAYLQRQQVKAQVWPLLSWDSDVSTPRVGADGGSSDEQRWKFAYHVRNDGVGPAIVRVMEVTFDGKPMRKWVDVLKLAAPPHPGQTFEWNASISGTHSRVVAAGEKTTPLEPFDDHLAEAMYKASERIAVTLCYCSVLDDCWQLHAQGGNDDAQPVPARTCFRPEVPFEE